jgi:hypothetical protein
MIMQNIFRLFLTSIFTVVCSSGIASAEIPFDAGRFIINLPDGYILGLQKNEAVYLFTGSDNGPQIMVVFYAQKEDLLPVFNDLIETAKGTFPDLEPESEIYQMAVNAHPAILGTYKGETHVAGMGPALFHHIVGTLLFEGKGVLAFFSSYSELQRDPWEDQLKHAFYSIRDVGERITGAQNSKVLVP